MDFELPYGRCSLQQHQEMPKYCATLYRPNKAFPILEQLLRYTLMYFSQIQLSSVLSLLFLTFSYLFKTKNKTGLFIKMHTLRNIAPEEKKLAWDHPQCTVVTFQCRIYSVLSEQTASCSHSRIHESKDYQSWRDPWGLITQSSLSF